MIKRIVKPEVVRELERPTDLETRIATTLCQHRRITRDMPSEEEIRHALPMARAIIRQVQAEDGNHAAQAEDARRERDAAIARHESVCRDYQRRIGDLVLRAERAEEEARRLSAMAGEF